MPFAAPQPRCPTNSRRTTTVCAVLRSRGNCTLRQVGKRNCTLAAKLVFNTCYSTFSIFFTIGPGGGANPHMPEIKNSCLEISLGPGQSLTHCSACSALLRSLCQLQDPRGWLTFARDQAEAEQRLLGGRGASSRPGASGLFSGSPENPVGGFGGHFRWLGSFKQVERWVNRCEPLHFVQGT